MALGYYSDAVGHWAWFFPLPITNYPLPTPTDSIKYSSGHDIKYLCPDFVVFSDELTGESAPWRCKFNPQTESELFTKARRANFA
jgi:hypothetical protein